MAALHFGGITFFVLSSGMDNNKKEDYHRREVRNAKGRGKGSQELQDLQQQTTEHGGVAIGIKHKYIPYIQSIKLGGSRMMAMTMNTYGKTPPS